MSTTLNFNEFLFWIMDHDFNLKDYFPNRNLKEYKFDNLQLL